MVTEPGRDMWRIGLVLWEGPESLAIIDDTDAEFLYGWQVLRLARRVDGPGTCMRLEARSVYADTRSEQPVAIIRGLYWNSRAPGYKIHRSPAAARFVISPLGLLEQWVAMFDGITIGVQREFDPDAPIRTLRVEWDYVASAFEVVWQGGALEHSDLSAKWYTVWDEMGRALQTLPRVRDVEEDWPCDLNKLSEPPFTTGQTSEITGYQLDLYPPLDETDVDQV